MKKQLLFIFASLFIGNLQAEEIHYQISTERFVKEMLTFSIPYSFGTHDGIVSEIQGGIITNEADQVLRAYFQVPIKALTTGNSTRDCHMREALGIDYSQSRFPKEHICTNDNSLPETGPDSVQYPNIRLDFLNMSLAQDPFSIGIPQISDVTVNMTIHGLSKIFKFEKITITKIFNNNGAQGFRIYAKLNLSLKDFNVQVKPLKIGPVSVNVKDRVSVNVAIDVTKI